MSSPYVAHWSLDPEIDFLNHGSYGAAPMSVLAVQAELRARMEREPVRFFQRDLQGLVDVTMAVWEPSSGHRSTTSARYRTPLRG